MKKYIYPLIIMFLFITGCNSQSSSGTGTFVNKSTKSISTMTVTICHQVFTKSDLKPGDSFKINFKINFDSDYDINIEFSDGKKLNKKEGYVTNGMSTEDVIEIYDSDVRLVSNKISVD